VSVESPSEYEKLEPHQNHKDRLLEYKEPAPRRGAVSVEGPTEYQKLQPGKNDRDKLLEDREAGSEAGKADEEGSSRAVEPCQDIIP
jgi:hypothetical protein